MRSVVALAAPAAGLMFVIAGFGLVLSSVSCSEADDNSASNPTPQTPIKPVAVNQSGFVGGTACAECHQQEHADWVGSHHDWAMKPANDASVLGDFDNATFEHYGVTSRFFKKDGKFYVHTDGPDGKLADFEIKYTYGVEPLQQYLVEFEGGRIQALTICWDTRPAEQGGQRWYHLYPDEAVPYNDALHWTGPNFTWNHMCAECHSTNLEKNYDEVTKTYRTTWSEMNVSCEACHGLGKSHVDWAKQYAADNTIAKGDMGLAVRLKDETRVWVMNPETGIAERRTPLANDTLNNACARCHSRRSQIAEGSDAGVPFLDNYHPAHLEENLYHADGQIQDEVYVWGSFVQSKMHMAGVTCMDCHNPHTAQVPTTTNQLCAKCHAPSKFDTIEHHHHTADSTGAQCINCHMPHQTYMGVDDRRDHSFRIPRPDLSVKLGVPNACNQCHTEQSAEWAAENAEFWWGVDVDRGTHFGEAFAAGRSNEPGADAALLDVLRDDNQPGIVRGTAVLLLSRYPTRRAAEGVFEAMASDEPMVRLAAADMLGNMPIPQRIKPAIKLLDDPLFAIRTEAGDALADVPEQAISDEQREKVKAGIAAYEKAQLASADTAPANMNLGSLAYRLGDSEAARKRYERVLEIDPTFYPAYANLATIYSEAGQHREAQGVIQQGFKHVPDSPDLYYTQALVFYRQRDVPEAIKSFAKAYAVAPERGDVAYAYAAALFDTGKPQTAIEILEALLEISPNDVQALVSLAQFNAQQRKLNDALKYARRAQEYLPDDAGLADFIRQLEAAQR